MKILIRRSLRNLLMLLLFMDIISIQSINSQNVTYPFKSFTDFRQTVDRLGNISDPAERAKGISELWDRLKGDNQVPFRLDDSVAFLYRGEATAVSWAGDFNGWKPGQPVYAGKRSGLSDIWMAGKNSRLMPGSIIKSLWTTSGFLIPITPVTK